MFTSLAQFITGYLFKNNIIDNSKLDIYIYGFEIMISNIVCFGIGLVLGAIFSQFMESVVFLLVFMLMRKYCGGYHANTYLVCDTIFTVNMLTVMTALKLISYFSVYVHAVIICMCFISIVFFAPIENKYKPLTIEKKKKHKLIAIVLNVFSSLISTALFFISIQYAIIIDMALATVAIFMIIEVLRKGREYSEKCQENIS